SLACALLVGRRPVACREDARHAILRAGHQPPTTPIKRETGATMSEPKHQPFVPESMKMTEFTARAVIPGLVMTGILGAANAYLGLRAGQTIAATYPAAVM